MSLASPNTAQPTFPPLREDPLAPPQVYARIRAGAGLEKITLWNGKEMWLVPGYHDARTVLADSRFSADSTRPDFPVVRPSAVAFQTPPGKYRQAFFRMDAPEHTRLRKMLTRDFIVRKADALRPSLLAHANELVDTFTADGRTDAELVAQLALPMPLKLICDMLGVPDGDRELFGERANAYINSAMNSGATAESGQAAQAQLMLYIDDLVTRRRAEGGGDDILGRLIADYLVSGELTHEDAVTTAMLLLIAGHETTANQIATSVAALIRFRDQWDLLVERPELIVSATEELLRYLSVVHITTMRVATEDVRVGNTLIRAGEAVLALLSAANRDDRHFERADELDITRHRRDHIAFGFGQHQCLGQPLARAEIHVALSVLTQRLPQLRLAVPFDDLQFRVQAAVHGVDALPVRW